MLAGLEAWRKPYVFRHVHAKGYQGVLGMEHGQSKEGKASEQAVIDAYVACDEF